MTPPDLVKAIYDEAQCRCGQLPCYSNRASQIGHECERFLVYCRLNWHDREKLSVEKRLIFDEGTLHEGAILSTLWRAGITVIEQQTYLEEKRYQLSGHVDGMVSLDDGKVAVLEIKSSSDYIWRSIAKDGARVYDWADVAEAFQARPWLRRYYAQLQVYMFAKECEDAILLIKSKGTGAYAQINVGLDWDYCESILQKADRINAHVAAGTYPDRIAWGDICAGCDFLHVCLPDRVNEDPLKFVEDADMEAVLEERAEAEVAGRRFKAADERIKSWVWAKYENESRITVGRWLIEKKLTRGGRRSTKIRELVEDESVEEK